MDTLSRRALLVNAARLVLLKWRLVRGVALPAVGMAALRILDRWAERAIDGPWNAEASRKVDRLLARREGSR